MSEFFKKLIKIQSTLNAPKNQYNSFGNYNYRNCEDIMEAVKPLLAAEDLFQTITDSVELIGDRFYVAATVTVTDGENSHSVKAYAREADIKKGMDSAQVTGATSSYARKYALNGMYSIDDSKDADTSEFRESAKKQAKQAVKEEIKNFDKMLKEFTESASECESLEQLQGVFKSAWKELAGSSQQQKAKEVYDTRKSELES